MCIPGQSVVPHVSSRLHLHWWKLSLQKFQLLNLFFFSPEIRIKTQLYLVTKSEMVIDMFCNATVAPSITGTESNTQLNIMTTLLAWEIIFCGLITYCRSVQNLSQWQRSVLQSLGAHMSRASHMLRQSISLDSWSASAGNDRMTRWSFAKAT